MTMNHAYVLCQVAAARKRLVASSTVRNGTRPGDGTPANFRQVLGDLSAMHRRHVFTQMCRRFQHRVALGAGKTIVGLPHVQGEGHTAPEELRTLVAVELDSAVHEVAVLVEVRTIGERLAANIA